MTESLWIDAVLTSLWAGGLATGLGALPALALRSLSERAHAGLAGFAGGVMLAATFFSLLAPGIELANARWAGAVAIAVAAGAFALGTGGIALVHRFLPHEHLMERPEASAARVLDRGGASLGRTWLFVLAITLHNVPEGLAVGVGVGSGEESIGLPIALAIAAQNAPEGLVVAISLIREGYGRWMSVGVALLTGMVEPIGAAAGAGSLAISAAALPIALCFAAGTMLFVISDEVLPESHRSGHRGAATSGVMLGFVLMMVLDTAFGG
ncbi:MAG: ZIP family metal transporter [Myxococcota bacterium]|nr:ZIP family metal transporter [Myxococcota bacterium]